MDSVFFCDGYNYEALRVVKAVHIYFRRNHVSSVPAIKR